MADQTTPREMRLVEMEDGWATAIERDHTTAGWPMIGMSAIVMSAMGALIVTDNPVFIAAFLTAPLIMLLFPMASWQHIRLRTHSLELARLYTRGDAKIDHVRRGEAGWMLVPQREATRNLPFSDMRELGFTDYSVWFDMNGERVEIVLEKTARGDIERLHDEIRKVWQRYRDGLTGSQEEADANRAELNRLASRSKASEPTP